MRFSRIGQAVAVAAVAAVALTSCATNEGGVSSSGGSPSASSLTGTVTGIGSSAQGTAQTTWTAAFQSANPKVTVNYEPQGSGAGRTNFIAGAADFAGSDAALKKEELASSFASCSTGTKGIDLPVYISPIAIIVNVQGVSQLKLDAATLAGIFKGTISSWDAPQIKALNPDASLPSARITSVHRSDDSGTTQNFTDYLAANAKDVWDAPAAQTFPYPSGDGAKGTSGVVDAVKNGTNTIGYADESGAKGMTMAQLKIGDTFSTISAQGAADVVAASPVAEGREKNDLAIAINRTSTEAAAWPLVLVSYLIVCQQYSDTDKGRTVKAYAAYIASKSGQEAAAAQAGSAPLSADLADKVATAISSIK
ncbi:phosphate ABC transporter substrate-binding protein PstS [Rathayibacter toxicus]|uniref:Phosphate-binding protein n=1 Tax=Rathayibacter toxicus TaxID=145458 RepID=A0A0C5B8S3_9MICO|nr:phosphate ABC transporter substrate-binding protein PstS [Rathayibacter toxicus]AJM77238.1 phosphate ABC transporter substrate-binding protein [Rathayibacter toxicus]ALS56902.1 phosphate ABC transporter substrate-binding protein [Rathayibacter toxicus]KKM46262.1 phosphate ABC transporter substrate-binding protein [Rathayibacter toxicus]PPG23225.1 phosphate ABC transporter substrate-binding protein PstS [Rathayibacter toxicus]PPG47809.1 phosphate ABC transporter substrate-binding protein Pst